MRIHRIKLCNYRGVSHSEVTFPAQGVTIIEGDNEIGKTSLSEAIDLLLAERDDSSKQRVKAVKPAHKDVGRRGRDRAVHRPVPLRLPQALAQATRDRARHPRTAAIPVHRP